MQSHDGISIHALTNTDEYIKAGCMNVKDTINSKVALTQHILEQP